MKFLTEFAAELENVFVFPEESNGKSNKGDDQGLSERIRVYPYAISWVSDPVRPILLFQDKDKSFTLPISMSPLEAGITIAQNSPHMPETNPHKVLGGIIEALGIKMTDCVFTEVRGHYQYAKISYIVDTQVKELHLRADEVVSSGLAIKIPFYTTAEFIQSSKVMKTDMEALQRNPQMQLQLLNRPNSYLM